MTLIRRAGGHQQCDMVKTGTVSVMKRVMTLLIAVMGSQYSTVQYGTVRSTVQYSAMQGTRAPVRDT